MSENSPHPATGAIIRTIAMPADTNPAGDIFGGWLMAQMDLAAGTVAGRRARGRVVTVAVDGMVFHKPVLVGDDVGMHGRIVRIGRTSITVHIEAWRTTNTSDEMTKVTEATFTLVAIDDDRRPRPVPPEA